MSRECTRPACADLRAARAETVLGHLMLDHEEEVKRLIAEHDPSGRLLENVRLRAHWARPRAGT